MPISRRNSGQGIFAPLSVTVADLFAGALLPAFALVGLYLLYLIERWLSQDLAGRAARSGDPHGLALAGRLARVMVAPQSC